MSDNRRWDAVRLRPGDIVISAPSKCGVTLTQRLVSLLVFDGPDLPGPMSVVSPWLDLTIRPIEEVVATLDAQRHRRFIKTHTPLDGLVLDDRVTYIGVGRDPRDAAMSELRQWDNMNRDRMRALRDALPAGAVPPHERFAPAGGDREPDPVEAFRDWMEGPVMPPDGAEFMPPPHALPPNGMGFLPANGERPRPPTQGIGSLANVLHHFGTLWDRRHLPNVALFHYADYRADLAGELVRLAEVLGVGLDQERARELARYATLDAMRARASEFAPDAADGIWHSNERFFRTGGSGEWGDVFTAAAYRRYYHRINQLAAPDLLAWAHEGRNGHDRSS